MPFPENMVQVRWEFSWKGTPEIQTTSCWGVVTQEGSGAFPDWQPTVDAIALKGVTAWAAQMGAAAFSFGVKANRVIAYHYRQDHKEVLHRGEAAFDPDHSWAGTASSSMPPQNTVVGSLYAYDPAGFAPQRARKRGRMYLPTLSPAQVDGRGVLTEGQAGTWASMFAALFDDLTGTLDVAGDPVASAPHWRPYVSSGAAQDAYKVTHVRVGTTVDTHRSRRNGIPETYVTADINV